MDSLPGDVEKFYCGCLLPGDVLVLPPGMVMVEKAVNCHSIGMRLQSHIVHKASMDALDIGLELMPRCFGLHSPLFFWETCYCY